MHQYQHVTTSKATREREILEASIERGREQGPRLIQDLIDHQPVDMVMNTETLNFTVVDKRVALVRNGNEPQSLHRHAVRQLVERSTVLNVPFLDRLTSLAGNGSDWAEDLLAHNLRESYRHTRDRVLIRSVKNEVRAVLSDSYRRLDSGQLIVAFMEAANELGAVPFSAYGAAVGIPNAADYGIRSTDLWWEIRVALPHLFEPVSGQIFLYTLVLRSSDYGAGKVSLSLGVVRVKCLNGMVGIDALGIVHLGERLPDNISWAEETVRLDSQATSAKIRDIARSLLSATTVDRNIGVVGRASEDRLDVKAALKTITGKRQLTAGEAKKVGELFSEPDVEMLPPGTNRLRLAQAISLFGNSKDVSLDRAQELQQLSWEITTAGGTLLR